MLQAEKCAAAGTALSGGATAIDLLAGNSVGEGCVCAVELPWALVGTEAGGYNEEFLAGLRDWLKALEEKKVFAFFVPVAGGALSAEEGVVFTASMKHCARRIKDCTSVVGFAVPDGIDVALFEVELHEKHGQYVFFSRNDVVLSDGSVVRY